MTNVPTSRTNREVLNSLRPPVARFYPCDLHVHSPGSFDVWQSGRFPKLPEELRRSMTMATSGTDIRVPQAGEPRDAGEFDEQITQPSLVSAFYESILDRRMRVAQLEGIVDSDNWAIVGVTDHNTAHFSSALSQHAWDRRSNNRLVMLPGIELEIVFPLQEANDECHVHILCLFAPCTKASDIRVAIHDARSDSASWSFGQVLRVSNLANCVDRLRSHSSYPALCVAAHVWSKKGVENEPKKMILASLDAEIARLQGEVQLATADNTAADLQELKQRLTAVTAHRHDGEGIHLEVLKLIGSCGFDALQIRDQTHEAHYRRLHRFLDTKGRAVPIVCSDAHNPDDVFSCTTGIPYAKVSSSVLSQGDPTTLFDEMRSRALRFGETRMTYGSPGRVRHWIEGIEIALDAADAHAFWSHSLSEPPTPADGQSFTLAFSRNLNCFVGGRGSGKSAGIEAISFLTQNDLFEQQAKAREKPDSYKRAAATLSGCRIRLFWKSTGSTGIGALPKKAIAISRYFDPDGRHELPQMRDIDDKTIVDDEVEPPQIRILRAHEIEETARPDNLRRLFDDLCGTRIVELEGEIRDLRQSLKEQRARVVSVCERLANLTESGGPLRQFAIRKFQFESVDKPELRKRFEEVDSAAAVSKVAKKTGDSWTNLATGKSLGEIAKDARNFFENGTAELINPDGSPIDGHGTLYGLLKESSQEHGQGHREKVLSGILLAQHAVTGFETALQAETKVLDQQLRDHQDKLEKEGLPTGSSERDAKKRAFDKAKDDYSKYKADLIELERLLDERNGFQHKLSEACEERTRLRKTYADQLTAQLARDLDGTVLRIEVDAKPWADRRQLDQWLSDNVDPIFPKFKAHRRSAWLKAGLMPRTLRAVLLDGENPDLTALRVPVARSEDGRVTDEDCQKILTACRGRQRTALDALDSWEDNFMETLPEDIRLGIMTFPHSSRGKELCVDQVLALDEIILDDTPEVRLNDRPNDPQSEPRPLEVLSPGQRCSAILPILLLSGDYPLVIDQPEENLDNRLIRQVIVNILATTKLKRQIIIATHNPNLPVLGDVEQCIALQARGRDLSYVVATGNLDSSAVTHYITDIMEGGREAFQYRQSIYQYHWSGPVEAKHDGQ
jgi:AAA domain, putative AbiEii toxin, Type IV TA system